ncbi:monocarboxylate transporter 12-like [Asterias rubens]|uniref:monocarboxylate transporter 12-like n=1 Tax=Asterias rubens TaxID=7604 RepID=UPI0014558B94|nr:monocarboxylate transporter 12-like [Asterias rubens]
MATKRQAEDLAIDGGLSGWIAVFTRWMSLFLWVVLFKGLGIMLPSLQQEFVTSTTLLGWIITMVGTTMGLAAPIAGLIGRSFGFGVTIMICGVMVGVAGVAGSFVTGVGQLAVVWLLLAGPGVGIAHCLSTAAIGRKFTKKLATAVGISKSGSSIALLVIAPLTQLILETYGWRGTMLLIGGLSFHLAVCGALIIATDTRQTDDYHVIRQDKIKPDDGSSHRCSSCCKLVFQSLDLKLLANPLFWAASVISCSSYASFDLWAIFFVSMAQSKGISPGDAAIIVTIAGVSNLLSKFVQGFVVSRLTLSYWGQLCITYCIQATIFYATPWLNSFWLLAVSSFVQFFFSGLNSVITELFFKQIMGADLLVGLYGWLGLIISLVYFSTGFLPGLIFDLSGNYDGAFIFIGILLSIPLIPLFIIRCKNVV